MADETQHWRRQFFFLFLVASLIEAAQASCGLLLWYAAASPALLAFGLDSVVGALREGLLAAGMSRAPRSPGHGLGGGSRVLVGTGYAVAGIVAVAAAGIGLWRRQSPAPTIVGVALAALSVLLIPIVGSYMKAVAIELKDPVLKATSIFTFGNSYLSMVLLVSLLVRTGMERWWGDPLGALVMAPFILQKGIGILSGPDEADPD